MPYKDKNRQNEYQRMRIAKRRADYLKYKICINCGESCQEKLQIDHIDPSKKVSHRIWSWNINKMLAELEKCQILCSKCHHYKTLIQNNGLVKEGTDSKYSSGCRCNKCKKAHANYVKDWRVRRKAILV